MFESSAKVKPDDTIACDGGPRNSWRNSGFTGTRLPVCVLFDNLIDELSLDVIIDSYPTLKREQAIATLCHAQPLLILNQAA